jgi:hypothetical protein
MVLEFGGAPFETNKKWVTAGDSFGWLPISFLCSKQCVRHGTAFRKVQLFGHKVKVRSVGGSAEKRCRLSEGGFQHIGSYLTSAPQRPWWLECANLH